MATTGVGSSVKTAWDMRLNGHHWLAVGQWDNIARCRDGSATTIGGLVTTWPGAYALGTRCPLLRPFGEEPNTAGADSKPVGKGNYIHGCVVA